LTIDVELHPGQLQPGRFNTQLVIAIDNKDIKTLEVGLSGEIVGPIEAQPERLYFGNFEAGKEITKTITLLSTENKNFRVTDVEVEDKSFTISGYDTTPKSEHVLEIHLVPSETHDRLRTDLKVHTDLPEHPVVEISIHGYKKRARSPTDRSAISKINPNLAPRSGRTSGTKTEPRELTTGKRTETK